MTIAARIEIGAVGLARGTVTINGTPASEIEKCVVDHEYGTVTFGTWEDALLTRDRQANLIFP